MTMHPRCKGVNLLELLLALFVVAALILTTMHLYSVGRVNANVDVAEHRINITLDAAYKWLEINLQTDFCKQDSAKKCTNQITMQKLLDAGLISPVDSQNPWTASPMMIAPPVLYPQYIQFRLSDIPHDACESLVAKLSPKAPLIDDGKPSCICSNTTVYCTLG